jgi:hypothetical protein
LADTASTGIASKAISIARPRFAVFVRHWATLAPTPAGQSGAAAPSAKTLTDRVRFERRPVVKPLMVNAILP